jgi:hypothetical protein
MEHLVYLSADHFEWVKAGEKTGLEAMDLLYSHTDP